MFKFILVFIFLYGTCYSAISQFSGDDIFDNNAIHEVRISSDKTISDLFLQFNEEFAITDYTYAIASITIDGNQMDSVGVRVKGGLSAFDSKKPLKVDFNSFVSGQKYDGLKKINLHQGNMDPTYVRESIAYALIRNSGIKTVRTSFANVYFNGTYEGVYTIVEQIDDDFIKRNFASNNGTLYKTGFSGLAIKYDNDTTFPFSSFKSAINNIPIDSLHIQLEKYLDVESFLRFIALQIYVNEADGPLSVNENYYLYYEPKSKKYVYIPWDYNVSFYRIDDMSVLYEGANFIFEKVKENTILRDRYLNMYCTLLETSLEIESQIEMLNDFKEILKNEVVNDPYIDLIGDFMLETDNLETYLRQRNTNLTAELENLLGSCPPFENPVPPNSIAINELVASNDSLSGITDGNGSYPDWIELYNNSNEALALQDLYLSNDVDFLKHWKFPKGTQITPNDYLIVWADRDVEEEGLHCDFKLNKAKGSLYLSNENNEIIDSISYSNQSTNVSLARIPNGVGNFIASPSTFNTNNEFVSTEDIVSVDMALQIFPTPAQNIAFLEVASGNSTNCNLQLISLEGRVLYETNLKLNQGTNSVEVDLHNYPAGFYSLSILNTETGLRLSKKLIIAD